LPFLILLGANGLTLRYEIHHGVRVLDGALIAAAQLSDRYLTSRRLPDKAIDLVDEACANVRVTRETAPEEIDQLQRRKLELEVEIHALEREKDEASKERLTLARKAIADVEDRLQPLVAEYEAERARGDEVASVRRKIDELKAKADEAERRYDLATASDLRYYALPELQTKLNQLERAKEEEQAAGTGKDVVTPEHIAEIVARWTSESPVLNCLSDYQLLTSYFRYSCHASYVLREGKALAHGAHPC
jgi:ATP-dependent Clp protease ATP-binding subunit ClpB